LARRISIEQYSVERSMEVEQCTMSRVLFLWVSNALCAVRFADQVFQKCLVLKRFRAFYFAIVLGHSLKLKN